MTGHGRGECVRDGYRIVVELSSVNRKQLELAINLPRELDSLEGKVREAANRKLSRGRLSARVSLETADDNTASQVQLNKELARAYTNEFRKLAKDLNLAGDVTLDTLLRAPGVVQSNGGTLDADAFWPALDKALKAALKDLIAMRQAEGQSLAADLAKRIKSIAKAISRIEKQAPKAVERYRRNLADRVAEMCGETVAVDEDRLAREVAYFADRCDISEELTRLQSHFEQFDGFIKATKPVGRTLDFLSQ